MNEGSEHIPGIPKEQEFNTKIAKRIGSAWDSCVGDFGYCDLTLLGKRLWTSLYTPDHALDGIGDNVRESTKQELRSPLAFTVSAGEPPELQREFIPAVFESIRGVDVRSTLFEGAIEQLHELDKRHNILVWTAGYKPHQEIKLAKSGLQDEKFQHLEILYPPETMPIESVINEDKFTEDILKKVSTFANDQKIVVVEDRVKNIVKFLDKFPDAKAVWVQQGAHAKKSLQRIAAREPLEEEIALQNLIAEGRVHVIDEIAKLSQGVESIYPSEQLKTNESLAIVCDFDDTLSDNQKRRQMDQDAIQSTIMQKGWLQAA